MVSVMTRIFIIGTIVARAKDGRKDSMVAQLKDPNLRDGDQALLK
jgi:RPA family protein